MKEYPYREIRYSDLSGWLKFATIVSWIIAGVWTIGFLIGFFGAI
jgi:hypothetical protein